VVVELSLREVEEIFLMRAVLEGLAARLGVAHIDDKRLEILQTTVEKLNDVTSYSEWLKFNGEFHHTIYQADERSHLLALIKRLRNLTAPYIRQYIASPEHVAAAQVGHRLILAACRNRDPALAESETIKHLEAVGQDAIAFARTRITE
jgi:DNA-binding GntR family transcriptional regulator